MKFAHLSDCHIGGWREDTLREINLKSFEKAVDICVENHVGFILIAGDLFDTALPSIDILKRTAKILSRLKDYDIPVYVIPGSHDFSASGKTMLDVLENSGLIINVMKIEDNKLRFTEDRTGVKITGMYGKKGGLESINYENLEKQHLEDEVGFKIFLFHTLIKELKPEEFEMIEAAPLTILPRNFSYYAGGHPHFVYTNNHENYGIISYPGPIFPNNFQEIEKLKHGGFFLVETKNSKLETRHIPLKIIDTVQYFINAEGKTPSEVEQELMTRIENYKDKILTIRIEGCLREGKTSDINLNSVFERFREAYCILKNTSKLITKEFQAQETVSGDAHNIELSVIREHLSQSMFQEEKIMNVIKSLESEKYEGERNSDFEIRIIKEVSEFIEL